MMNTDDNYRFLFVTADEFPTSRPDVAILFGKCFVEKGHEIDWIVRAADCDSHTGCIDWQGYKMWVAPTNTGSRRIDRVRKHLQSLRNELRIFSLVRRRNYDFIQVKDKFIAAIMGLLATWRTKTPFIYWLSFPYPEASFLQAKAPDSRYPFFYVIRGMLFDFLLYRIICPRADHVVVQSEEMKRQMVLRGVKPDKMTALPMGVDSDLLSFSASHEQTLQKTIAYLGVLDRIRKLEFLLQAFALIARKHADAKVVFVGDSDEPSDRIFLESEAERLNIADQVCFTGFLSKDKALQVVANASVCVSPIPSGPVFDVSSPTKTLEYMAMAKPVVANDIPDTVEVLQDSGGGICTPYDVKAFSDGIDWILCHPEEALRMGERGREYIRLHRTYSSLADQLEKSYKSLLQHTGARE